MSQSLTSRHAELNERAWEAIDSLVRTLGSTLNAREIAKRSLLTVTGQLLLQRAAFYVLDEGHDHLLLMESLGVRREQLGHGRISIDDSQRMELDSLSEILDLGADHWLPHHILSRFEFAARVSEGNQTLGLLLLGGKIGRDHFDDLDRRLLRTMGMVMGTTLQRSLSHQQMLEAKRRTEAIQSLQQQILDHVSHEFNTPLTVIRSSVDMMRESTGEMADQAYGMHGEALDRLQGLVQSIVDAGSATFHEGVLEERTVEEILYLCLGPLVESSRWRDELVVQSHDQHTNACVRVDLGGLRTALDALLDNAWKFSHADRRRLAILTYIGERDIWMSLDHRTRLAAFAECDREALERDGVNALIARPQFAEGGADSLIIEVYDAGIGVPTNERGLIFEPFSQASNSPFRNISGTGVGLMAARSRVESMQGEIRVVSTERMGSLFAILLPLAATEA